MARTYWRVSPAFWGDEKVTGWSDDAKVLALYLLTCEHRTVEGLFRLPKGYIIEDLGWDAERLGKPFGELLRDGFIEYDEKARMCLIVNALEYQSPENPNQVKAAIRFLADLPESVLFARLLERAERLCQPFAEGLRKGLPERFGEGFGKPPTPTPAPAPGGRAHAREATPPVEKSGEEAGKFAGIDFGDEPSVSGTPGKGSQESQAEELVAFYRAQRKELGSLPTDRQVDVIGQAIAEKLGKGSRPEAVREAVKRLVAKGRGPSTLPAFVDEVEAERRAQAPPPRTPFVPPKGPDPDEPEVPMPAFVKEAIGGIGRGMP